MTLSKGYWTRVTMLSRTYRLKELQSTKFLRQFTSPIASYSTGKPKVSQSVENSGQRDLVNFPKVVRLETNPPCVFGLLPKSWFDFFYSKTGVTGGYTFLFNTTVYLFSKEIIVCDHEFILFLGFVSLCVGVARYVPEIGEFVEKGRQNMENELNEYQENSKKVLRDNIEDLLKNKSDSEAIVSMLPEAKRENVYLQLEAAYRMYLKDAHSAVLNVLNYNVEKSNIERLFRQKHLTKWLLNSVEASITPDVKKVSLEKAISDLKSIAASRGG